MEMLMIKLAIEKGMGNSKNIYWSGYYC